MGSKKIIVPQGLINPNETTIIEIPAGVDSGATLIARSTPTRDDCVPCTSGQKTPNRASPGRSPQRTVRAVTSITTIESTDAEIPPISRPNTTRSPYANRSGNQSSLGVLGRGYMDSTRSTDPNSFGILGPGYMDSTRGTENSYNSTRSSQRNQQNQSMGILGPGYFDSTNESSLGVLGQGYMDETNLGTPRRRVRQVTSTTIISNPNDSMGILGPGYMDSTRNTNETSLGVLGSGYMDSSRNTNQSTLGVLGSGYMDSTRYTNQTSLGVLGSGYMDSTRNTNQSSLGVLGPGYMNSTRSSTCPGKQASPSSQGSRYRDNQNISNAATPKRIKKTVKKVVTETPSNISDSLGLLDPNIQSSFSSGRCPAKNATYTKMPSVSSQGYADESYINSTRLASLPSRNRSPHGFTNQTYTIDDSRYSAPLASSTPKTITAVPSKGFINESQNNSKCPPCEESNLSQEVQRRLDEMEQNERQQINMDLSMFQQARRRLVEDTTNISSFSEL